MAQGEQRDDVTAWRVGLGRPHRVCVFRGGGARPELTCCAAHVSGRRFPGGLGCGGAEDGHAARQAEGAAGQGGCSPDTRSATNWFRATGMPTLYLVVYAPCHMTWS